MVRMGFVGLFAALAASAVCAQQVYRHVLPDGRVVYNDTPPAMTTGVGADSAPASKNARGSDDFGAGARLIVPPQELKR